MTLLLPLGLLGLLGIVALIVIYIIRPNYQQKSVSGTYIWKLSLKYKKKKLPIDRLRNLLLLICQILILALMAWILAKPATVIKAAPLETDVIAVVDSSASMYAEVDDETRFQRAINGVIDLANQTFSGNGYFSIILADDDPYYLYRRTSRTNSAELMEKLEDLLDPNDTTCSYGTSDIDAALLLCEEVLEENPTATIYLYTDTEYDSVPEDIIVKSVRHTEQQIDGSVIYDEWNAAILNVTAEPGDDASYVITVDVGAYGGGCNMTVTVDVEGADAADSSSAGNRKTYAYSVFCSANEEKQIIFASTTPSSEDAEYYPLSSSEKFYSYQNINVYIDVNDSSYEDCFSVDNSFTLCGGQKQVLKVQYASALPADFFPTALYVLKSYYNKQGLWDMQITEVKEGKDPELSGYDFYIFEHTMPEELPTDGVVFLVDPDPLYGSTMPSDAGLKVVTAVDLNGQYISLLETEAHPVTQYIDSDEIYVSRYVRLTYDSSYKALMTCNGDPVILVKNEINDDNTASQVAVMAFSTHYSNLSHNDGVIVTMLANMFEYYLPATISDNSFDVNETITVNARSNQVKVTGVAEFDKTYTETPVSLKLELPGVYTITQTTYYGKAETQTLFVKIPSAESDVQASGGSLTAPYRNDVETDSYIDWLVYLAGALAVLVFTEWILKSLDNV